MARRSNKVAIIPTESPTLIERWNGDTDLKFSINRYIGWTEPAYAVGKSGEGAISVNIPPFVNFVYLNDADKSDPNNQLRCLSVRIADRLAYKVVATAAEETSERDILLLLIAALFFVGVEYGSEIRDAIAVEHKMRR